jgi:site-specific DNA-cytosine methylase
LDRRIRLSKGEKLEPYLDEDGNAIPDLPNPGEVDMVNGGPPCPGYSGINRYKTWDDIKNTLVILFLSYLEFYKPKYFLLENVRGLLSHRVSIGIRSLFYTIALANCSQYAAWRCSSGERQN